LVSIYRLPASSCAPLCLGQGRGQEKTPSRLPEINPIQPSDFVNGMTIATTPFMYSRKFLAEMLVIGQAVGWAGRSFVGKAIMVRSI
jgi:hypothetical protein